MGRYCCIAPTSGATPGSHYCESPGVTGLHSYWSGRRCTTKNGPAPGCVLLLQEPVRRGWAPRLALTTARVLAWLGYTPPRVYVGVRRRMARRLRLATARARGSGIGSHAGIRAPARIHGVAEVHPCWGALGRGPEAYQSRDVRRSVIYNTRKHATVLYCTAACHGPPLPEARPEPLAIWVGQFYWQ